VSAALTWWCNGRATADGSVGGRGLQYGDGVFRTLLKFGGVVVDEAAQLQKLQRDAARLGIVCDAAQRAALAAEMHEAAGAHRDAAVKLMLVRVDKGRGYPPGSDAADRHVAVYPLPRYPATHWSQGVTAAVSTLRVARQPVLAGIKHLNRLEQVMAYRAAPPEVEEVVLLDTGGAVVGGGRSNLFCVREGVLHTPELSNCGVRGLMRDTLQALAPALGIELRCRDLSLQDVEEADEVFMTNSLIGIWPIRMLGTRRWATPGPVTARLVQRLAHPWSG
jgi:4-amino-4-deoxychorismate lyase